MFVTELHFVNRFSFMRGVYIRGWLSCPLGKACVLVAAPTWTLGFRKVLLNGIAMEIH